RLVVAEDGYHLLIKPGTALGLVAQQLERDQVLDEPFLLRLMARLDGSASRVKAGEYQLLPGLTPRRLLRMLVSGEVVLHSFTIIEGWTFKQMMQALRNHPAIEHTLDGAGQLSVMELLGEPGAHPEGLFYPDTYRFPRGTTDVQFLRRAHHALRQRLLAEWEQRAEGLPLKDPYEALILASIIERETGVDAERGKVAGVFVRRLQRGMRLQTDPTVIYGV